MHTFRKNISLHDLAATNRDRCFGFVVTTSTSEAPAPNVSSLRGDRDIDVERFVFDGGSTGLSGLSPQFCCGTQRFVSEWKVTSRRGIDESVEPVDSRDLPCPKELTLDLIVDDGCAT